VRLWIACLAASTLLNGQTIATDRPAVTDSSIVVPKGSLQFENGTQVTDSTGHNTFDGPETLLRIGIASRTELRFTAPDYYSAGAGFGDLALGVKQQISHTAGGFDLSAVVSLSLPSGARAISSHGYDPALQLPWSQKLSENWTAAGMLSVYGTTSLGKTGSGNETTPENSLFCSTVNSPDLGTPSWNTRAISRSAADRGTCCMWKRPTNWRRGTNSISTWESGCLPRRRTTSLVWAIPSL